VLFQFQRQLAAVGTEESGDRPGSVAKLDRARTESSSYSYEDDDGQAAREAMRHGGHEDGHAQTRRSLQAAGKPRRNFGFFFFFTPLLLLSFILENEVYEV